MGLDTGNGAWMDIVAYAKTRPEMYKGLAIRKLSVAEHKVWNKIFNQTIKFGVEDRQAILRKQGVGVAANTIVYMTQIENHNDDIMKLTNGGILELTEYVGFVGFHNDAVLFSDNGSWKIWVKGKKTYSCQIIKRPAWGVPEHGEKISVLEVKGDGKIITTIGDSIYEVGDFHTFTASSWFGCFEGLVIGGRRLVNLGAGDEIIDVTKLK